jgi:hypothetical protein
MNTSLTMRAFVAGVALLGTVAFAAAQDAAAPEAPPADAPAVEAPAAPVAAKPVVKKVKKAAAKPLTSPMFGVWTGNAIQVGRAGGYPVAITISAKGAETDYPNLSCGGTLTKVGAKGDDSFFIETITRGAFDPGSSKGCLSGTVTLVKANEQLIWGWIGTFGGKPVVAYATLTKQPPIQQ